MIIFHLWKREVHRLFDEFRQSIGWYAHRWLNGEATDIAVPNCEDLVHSKNLSVGQPSIASLFVDNNNKVNKDIMRSFFFCFDSLFITHRGSTLVGCTGYRMLYSANMIFSQGLSCG